HSAELELELGRRDAERARRQIDRCEPENRLVARTLESELPPPGTDRVTVARAASEVGVSTATVHRWLREGFITGEQMTRNAPWQINITPELRARVCQAPDGWLPLADAVTALGLARQTVLHKV
ncbi:MAG: hypothetical protein M3065_15095, partial [Actinomycetota bacterium]|nr:hypothetical protein [Actinomycetota bacterium]